MNDNFLPVWNPFQKGYFDNPHLQLSVLREQNPVHKGINGRWMLFRYDDVKFVLSNPQFRTIKLHEQLREKNQFLGDGKSLDYTSTAVHKWLFFVDPPHHTQLRSLVVKLWNTYRIKQFIEQVVNQTIDQIADHNEVEIVKDFAEIVPIKIICHILGIPFEDYQQLREWATHFAKTLEPFESLHKLLEHNQKAKEFCEYIEEVIHCKRITPDDSFISNFLIANNSLKNPMQKDELVSIFIILFFAGIETSIYLFSQSIYHLIREPDLSKQIRTAEYPDFQIVEELVRYSSPLQYAPRVSDKDVKIGNVVVPAREIIMSCVAAANRDPKVFENPEKIDFSRKANPHLSFGHGFHHCIGAKLARDEMTIAIPKFVKKFSQIKFNPDLNYEWEKSIINRGLKSLHVILN